MQDSRGQAHALTVLTPVVRGRGDGLRTAIGALSEGAASPLARIETTHFARWVVIGELVYGGAPQPPDRLQSEYLLFTSNFDGPLDDYIAAIPERIAAEADSIWGHCVGCPGPGDAAAFAAYLRRHRIRTGLLITPYEDATVADVRAGLAARERLAELAVRAQDLDAAALQSAYRDVFGTGALAR